MLADSGSSIKLCKHCGLFRGEENGYEIPLSGDSVSVHMMNCLLY